MGLCVSLAIDTTITHFWRDRATGELRMKKAHDIMRFLKACWQKKNMDGLFSTGKDNFEALMQDVLSMSVFFLLALCLYGSLFNMGPAFLFSRIVETLRVYGYLTLTTNAWKSGSVLSPNEV